MIRRIILVGVILVLGIFHFGKQELYANEIVFKDGITIRGEWFYLDGERFVINAIGYAGWRPGQWPGADAIHLDFVVS